MSVNPPFENIALVGLGLLGGSLAEAVRRQWPDVKISGISSSAALARAQKAGLIDFAAEYSQINEVCEKADLILLCTPIHSILQQLKTWKKSPPKFGPKCVVSDVGSTKVAICAAGREAFPASAQGPCFIGSHPMAGSERTGLEARDPHLFENASWVICPDAQTPADTVNRYQNFLEGLGARTTLLDPDLHDAVAAHVSHLPQLISTALASFVSGREGVVEHCLKIAGGGFRDMTRIAASSYSIWEPILRTNRKSVSESLEAYITHLSALGNALHPPAKSHDNEEKTTVAIPDPAEFFQRGGELRKNLSTLKKGFSTPLAEILVDLRDQPGMLLSALTPLAAKSINVLDLEILKVREGEDGSLMMAFKKTSEAEAAVQLLIENGFKARLR